jgi:hypothetical protein
MTPSEGSWLMPKPPILLTDEIMPPPALVRAGFDMLPAIILAQGEPRQPPLHRVFYHDHPQPQHPNGIRAG